MIEALKAASQRGVANAWEVTCIQSVWGAHWENIHSHHTSEDNIMVPFLKTRFEYPDKVSVCTTRMSYDCFTVSIVLHCFNITW
jgi:hypothetical protein